MQKQAGCWSTRPFRREEKVRSFCFGRRAVD
nr:MAG TPA: hypothetical protein [Bacteriophage sp.]